MDLTIELKPRATRGELFKTKGGRMRIEERQMIGIATVLFIVFMSALIVFAFSGCGEDEAIAPATPTGAKIVFVGKKTEIYGTAPFVARSIANAGDVLARDVIWTVHWTGQRRAWWWQVLAPGDTVTAALYFEGPIGELDGSPAHALGWDDRNEMN